MCSSSCSSGLAAYRDTRGIGDVHRVYGRAIDRYYKSDD
jgi:hypothetical protein